MVLELDRGPEHLHQRMVRQILAHPRSQLEEVGALRLGPVYTLLQVELQVQEAVQKLVLEQKVTQLRLDLNREKVNPPELDPKRAQQVPAWVVG